MFSRCRKVQPDNSAFALVPGTLNTYLDSVTVDLVNNENGHLFVLKVAGVKENTFRIFIDEKTPLKGRYRVKDALHRVLMPEQYAIFVYFSNRFYSI